MQGCLSLISSFFLFLLFPASLSFPSTYPGPSYLHPQIHFSPKCVNGVGFPGSKDIAGALTIDGMHHVFQLCKEGWHHASSKDLVHWTSHNTTLHAWPSGFVTEDERTGDVCAGFRGSTSFPNAPHKWDAPLVLRCWKSGNFDVPPGPEEPLFNVVFGRSLPFDPIRPWKGRNGNWYVGVSLDACNSTVAAVEDNQKREGPCPFGGQIDLWTSPFLRGKGAHWRKLEKPLFRSNRTIFNTDTEAHEFVTSDYFSVVGKSGYNANMGKANILFTNPYFSRGSTGYFLGQQQAMLDSTAFTAEVQSMLDWGEFLPNSDALACHNASRLHDYQKVCPVGVDALNRTTMALPFGGRFGMARTLGSKDPNQVLNHGRRVAVAWISANVGRNRFSKRKPRDNSDLIGANAMSLPRDLTLCSWPNLSPILLQAFVPELKQLRRAHEHTTYVASSSSSSFPSKRRLRLRGQQLEIFARVDLRQDVAHQQFPFGLFVLVGDGEGTSVTVHPRTRLVCIDGTRQGNAEQRCGPLFPSCSSSSGAVHVDQKHQHKRQLQHPQVHKVDMHVIVDHSIIEVIVNNSTAITGSVSPSRPSADRVEFFVGVLGNDRDNNGVNNNTINNDDNNIASFSVDVWKLARGNFNGRQYTQ